MYRGLQLKIGPPAAQLFLIACDAPRGAYRGYISWQKTDGRVCYLTLSQLCELLYGGPRPYEALIDNRWLFHSIKTYLYEGHH
jgi:hypothetical protein